MRSQTKIKEERSEELDIPAFNDVIFGEVHSSICWQILEHSLGKKQERSCLSVETGGGGRLSARVAMHGTANTEALKAYVYNVI